MGYKGLLSDIYINKVGGENYKNDLPGYKFISGVGMLNFFYDYLACDSLGFRLIEETNGLKQLAHKDRKNILIVGGSFAQSIFSVPGHTFTDYLNKSAKEYFEENTRFWNFAQRGSIQSDNFCQMIQLGILERIDCVIWIDGLNDCSSSIPLKSINIDYDEIAISGKSIEDIPLIKPHFNRNDLIKDKFTTYLNYRKRMTKMLERMGIRSINICQPICDFVNKDIPSFTRELVPYGIKAYEVNMAYHSWCQGIKDYAEDMFELKYTVFDREEINPIEYADFCHLTPNGEKEFAKLLVRDIQRQLN